MGSDQNAARDDVAARSDQRQPARAGAGLVVRGRLRALSVRDYTDRRGQPGQAVDAVVLAGNATYSVAVGTQLRAKELTGHVAPWQCEEDSSGEPVELAIAVKIAVGPTGPFISYRAAQQ